MKQCTVFLMLLYTQLLVFNVAQAQCNPDAFVEEGLGFLKSKNFNFLKSYKIDGQGGMSKEIEFSYVFSTGTSYLIFVNNGRKNAEGIVITVEDADRQQIAKSFVGDTYVPAVQIVCNRTGIYYIRFSLLDRKNDCASAVLGFKR